MVGGGVRGKAVGIAHIIITGDGRIMAMFPDFILMWTLVGEDTIETILGTDIDGTMNGFLIKDFNRTGKAGRRIDTGKNEELGAFRDIKLDRSNSDRSSGISGRRSISRGLRFSGTIS